MTSQWTEESFTNEALAVPFQKISSTTWMQRRNIRKKTKTLDDETTYEYYTCESRVITNNEYISYLSDQVNAITPYTETKTAYIGDTEVVFFPPFIGNVTVYFDKPFTMEKLSDRIIITFDELEEVAEITISII